MNLKPEYLILILVLAVWSYVWKGVAMWHAARKSQRNWFVAFLITSTVGILEIIYLWRFEKREK